MAPREPLDDRCRELMEALRKECPDLLPSAPLRAGASGPQIVLEPKSIGDLVEVAGRGRGPDSVLWQDVDNELLVHVGKIQLDFGNGVLVVTIPVRCDQTGETNVEVVFVVGDDKRPAGLIAATEGRPRGPAEVVDVWGRSLVTLAWDTLLRVMTAVAAESGKDLNGAGLVPSSLSVSPDGLQMSTMARHSFDSR